MVERICALVELPATSREADQVQLLSTPNLKPINP